MSRESRFNRPRRAGARACVAALVAVVCVVAACSSYVRRSSAIRAALASGQFDAALDEVAGIEASNSLLLHLYERGMVLHCRGDHAASNLAFERAEAYLDVLHTRSITRGVTSLAVSETIEQYRGDAYEAVFVNYYKILNYLALGDAEDAMVECRRINRRLQRFQDAGETYFVNDPFLQYLTGMVFTRGGEWTDADVSYRLATRLYDDPAYASLAPVPSTVFCDAAALSRAIGDRDAADVYAARAQCPDDGLARVNVFLDCGEIAQKGEANVVLPIFESDRWDDNEKFAVELSGRYNRPYARDVRVKYWLKVSLPALVLPAPRYARGVLRARASDERAGTDARTQAMLVANLDAHAQRAFEEKQSTVLVRAIVRGLIKYAAFNAAEGKDGGFGAVVNLLNIATETADTRNWSTLPQAVWMARFDLPPGEYDIEADLFSDDGVRRAGVSFRGVQVRRGGMVFRHARVF